MSLTPRIDKLEPNLFINGGLHFWQRGTSFTSIAHNTYSADRIKYLKSGAMVNDITRSTDVPSVIQAGFPIPYSLKVDVTTIDAAIAASDNCVLRTHIEGYDFARLHRKKCRLQFWVKSTVTGDYGIGLANSANNRSYASKFTINSASTWELKTFDIEMDQAGVWLFDNGVGLRISIALSAGATFQTASLDQWQNGEFFAPTTQVNFNDNVANDFWITGFQLISEDLSSVSGQVPFFIAGRNIAEELELCQRYYEKSYNLDDAPGTATNVGQIKIQATNDWVANATAIISTRFCTRKRTNVVGTLYSPGTGSVNNVQTNNGDVAGTLQNPGETSLECRASTPGASWLFLQYHFTADADF